jgi:hypothetical protein
MVLLYRIEREKASGQAMVRFLRGATRRENRTGLLRPCALFFISIEAVPKLKFWESLHYQFLISVCPQSRLLCGQTLHLLPFCTKTVRKMPVLR